jgi:hypothetical protein
MKAIPSTLTIEIIVSIFFNWIEKLK